MTASGGSSNDRTLIQSDADGDYIPDALDNCASVQNPGQDDADGDGHGDACPVVQDTDGDGVADSQDNCPTVGTSDFSDRDGDGVGDSCDKSPDGVEPEPEPLPDLDGQGGEAGAETAPVNGEGVDGESVERDGRSRSKERSRTDTSRPQITTGSDASQEGAGGPPAQEESAAEEPVRDNPRRNEELIAEAAASGELNAPPEPPPVPQRAWDEEAAGAIEWESIVRIDAGATDDAAPGAENGADDEPNDEGRASGSGGESEERGDPETQDVGDSEFARGWVRAKLLLQDESEGDPGDAEADAEGRSGDSAPVPVENGLVIEGSRADEADSDSGSEPEDQPGDEPLGQPELAADREPLDVPGDDDSGRQRANERDEKRDGSRRDGSSRSAAATVERPEPASGSGEPSVENAEPRQETRERERRGGRDRDNGAPEGWSDDRYYSGGSALNWSGDIGVAGTDDDGLYLTQRSGSGPGKRRGFEYAIPVDDEGVYLVRLYFAEPYWGTPGGPEGEEGRRIFSVDGEGEALLEEFDVYAEVGSLTALVKQAEVEVTDGELNLRFTASEGEPIVAAIEVLQPAP